MPYVLDGNAVYSDNDLLVYDNNICQHIVFEDFLLAGPVNRIPGRAVYSGCDAIWRRKGDTFYLYYRGRLQTEDLVDSRMGKNGKDLEVTRHSSSTRFILPDYAGRDDNTLRPAYLATD
jgi:hypothetical protein